MFRSLQFKRYFYNILKLLSGYRDGNFGKYACPNCKKTYRYPHGLSRHLKYECGIEPQFQCPICPYKAKHKGHLKTHIGIRHALSKI